MPTIFVSHSSDGKALAVQFKGIVTRGAPDLRVFLSSDWDSVEAGAIWLQEIESALATHTHFIALIIRAEDSRLPWICYEVGYPRGRCVVPKIFVFRNIELKGHSLPASGDSVCRHLGYEPLEGGATFDGGHRHRREGS